MKQPSDTETALRAKLRDLLIQSGVERFWLDYRGQSKDVDLQLAFERGGQPMDHVDRELDIRELSEQFLAAACGSAWAREEGGRGGWDWDVQRDYLDHEHFSYAQIEVPSLHGDRASASELHSLRVDHALSAVHEVMGNSFPLDQAGVDYLKEHLGTAMERTAADRECFLDSRQRRLLKAFIGDRLTEPKRANDLATDAVWFGRWGFDNATDAELVTTIAHEMDVVDLLRAAENVTQEQSDFDLTSGDCLDVVVEAMKLARSRELLEAEGLSSWLDMFEVPATADQQSTPKG